MSKASTQETARGAAPALAAPGAAEQSASVAALRSALLDIDAFSQEGFTAIATIAKLALKSLESPDGYDEQRFDDLANAFQAILKQALETEACINGEADAVGCGWLDEAAGRRAAAHLAHARRSIAGPSETA